MFKLTFKLLIATALLTGVCLVFSSDHAAADAPLPDNCGSASDTSLPPGGNSAQWGNDSDGEGAGVMASLILRARDTSGNPLNPHIALNSSTPGDPNGNAQIYQWPIGSGGRVSNTDTWPAGQDFQVGANMSGGGGAQCNGWLVFGPGIPGNIGNGWVLNCKSPLGADALFWFSNISNPGNQAGRWELLGADGQTILSDVNNQAANYQFKVVNGSNHRFTLVWHPTPPPPPPTTPPDAVLDITCNGFARDSIVEGHMTALAFGGTTADGGTYWVTHSQSYVQYPGQQSPALGGGSISLNYHALKPDITISLYDYTWNSTTKAWDLSPIPYNPYTLTYHCYEAKCSTPTVQGDGPGGIVLAGHNYTVTVPVQNSNNPATHPNAQTIPSNVDANYFKLAGAGGDHNTGFSLNPLETRNLTFTLTAPSTIVPDFAISFTPQLGGNVLGNPCSATVRVYQQFSASLSSSSNLKPTTEHPYQGDDYKTSINVRNDSSQAVSIPTSSEFYKLPAGGGKTNIPPSDSRSGPFGSSPGGTTTNTLARHYDIPAGSYQAGDEFCAHIHADYTAGYVGPDGGVVFPSGGGDDYSCPRIANEPYFKVVNGSIAAGGEFGKCSTDGGTLAGYADISDPPGATRGSSAQLSALALLKITGVASAQSPGTIDGSPTKLTFANTGVQVDTAGNESPVLGGQFGGCRTLTNVSAPNNAQNITTASFNVGGANGAHKHSGDLTISGGSIPADHNVSVFVDGDVYISSDITYGTGWDISSAPSFVLHATGNIYIKPSVTKLAGLYIAQSTGATGGKIYTCADSTGFAPVSASNLYNSCKNQLVVYGSFVADQINLMRSFGSLRDEVPNPGTPATPGTDPTPGAKAPLTVSSSSGPGCTKIDEPRDMNYKRHTKYICVSAADQTETGQTVRLGWVHDPNGGTEEGLTNCTDDWGDVLHGLNYRNYNHWDQDFLCSNVAISFSGQQDTSKFCTLVSFNTGSSPNKAWPVSYVCIAKSAPAKPGTPGTSPTPKGPPYTCSNQGTIAYTISGGALSLDNLRALAQSLGYNLSDAILNSILDQIQSGGLPQILTILRSQGVDTSALNLTGSGALTCAGEIFEYSPALYLANPAINPPGGGSLQLQSVTSLPPVL